MVTSSAARAAATTKSPAAHGIGSGRPLSRNASRRWQRRHRSKVSLDGRRSKTSASDSRRCNSPNLSPPLERALESAHPSSMRTRAADRLYLGMRGAAPEVPADKKGPSPCVEGKPGNPPAGLTDQPQGSHLAVKVYRPACEAEGCNIAASGAPRGCPLCANGRGRPVAPQSFRCLMSLRVSRRRSAMA